MTVRGKFKVDSITHHATTGPENVYAEVKMNAVYTDKPEDHTFSKATPSAQLTMAITVPEVVDTFKPGKFFYVDFTEAE